MAVQADVDEIGGDHLPQRPVGGVGDAISDSIIV